VTVIGLVAATRDLDVLLGSIESSAELQDVAPISRAVLQAIRGTILFEWRVVPRIYPDDITVAPSGAEVVSTYPTGLASIDRGAAWAPLDAEEQTLLDSGELSLNGRLTATEAESSRLRRLPAFGMRSRLLVSLFAPASNGQMAASRSTVRSRSRSTAMTASS